MNKPWLSNLSEPLRTATLKSVVCVIVAIIIFAVRTTGVILQVSRVSINTTVHGASGKSGQETAGSPPEGSPGPIVTSSPHSTSVTPAPSPAISVKNSSTPKPIVNSTSPTPTPLPTASSTPTPIPVSSPTPTPTPTPTPVPTPVPVVYKYRNGTYSAVGAYSVPGGTTSIGVSLQVYNDKVTASTVTANGTGTSLFYQNDFIANYQPYVIGKSLDTLSLTKISMSSLTPVGFNNAATSIRSQAL